MNMKAGEEILDTATAAETSVVEDEVEDTEQLGDDLDDDLLEEIGRLEKPPKQALEEPPTVPVEEEGNGVVPSSPAPSQPLPTTNTGTEKAAPPQTEEAPKPSKTAEEIMVEVQARLEKDYALTPEQATDFIARTEEVVPKMLARVHAKAVSDTLRTVQEMLPSMIKENTERVSASNKALEEFVSAAPFLKEHIRNPVIGQVAQLIMRTEPKLSREDFIKKVALGAAVLLGVQPTASSGKPTESKPGPRPAIVKQGSGNSSAGGMARQVSKKESNAFTELSRAFEQDDSE